MPTDDGNWMQLPSGPINSVVQQRHRAIAMAMSRGASVNADVLELQSEFVDDDLCRGHDDDRCVLSMPLAAYVWPGVAHGTPQMLKGAVAENRRRVIHRDV